MQKNSVGSAIAVVIGVPVPQTRDGMQAWADKIDAALSSGLTFQLISYDSVVWPDGPLGRAVVSHWRRP